MDPLAKRVAARFLRGSEQGPFGNVTEHMVHVWIEMDSYGRVHHVTGDLQNAEKRLEKVKNEVRDVLSSNDIMYDQGDIYVDGLPGGRNRMIVNFHYSARPDKWTPEQQETIKQGLKGSVSAWKKPPSTT